MNKYRQFILEAKIGGAPGFGRPASSKPSNKKPLTKHEIGTWRARSENFRKKYLEDHPDSRYKDVKATGNIITHSKKISNKPEAQAVTTSAASWLIGMGLKHYNNKKEAKPLIHKNVSDYLKTKDRSEYTKSATEMFTKHFSKLSAKDKSDIQDEVNDIHNNPTKTPSKTLDRKGRKGKFPALLGVAVGAAILGSVAISTGFVPPDVFAYLGVKALDSAVEAIRGVGDGDSFSDTFITLMAGQAIGNYFKSKASDEYAESVKEKTAPEDALEEEEDTTDDKPKETKKEDDKPAVSTPDNAAELAKKGVVIDMDKYTQDEKGNLVLKKKANDR